MKIAVAAEGNMVTGHFGHCLNFEVFDVEDGSIVRESRVPNPGHRPGFLPNFLADLGVTTIISGGMGAGAVEIFESRGIQVVTGARGEARQAASDCLSGSLKSTGSICHEHSHADSCGEHGNG